MTKKSLSSGFSMLELSIVVVIIAVITGMGLTATVGMLESANRAATRNKLDVIEEALMAFRIRYNRLPCPGNISQIETAGNYSLEGQPLGGCTTGAPAAALIGAYTARGSVPAKALGIPESFMHDGWGRKFVYLVDNNATYVDAFDVIKVDEFCEVEIQDAAGSNITGDKNYLTGAYDNGAIYTLLSLGPNGHGGYTVAGTRASSGSTDTDELQNCRCDSTGADSPGALIMLVKKEETSAFDDIVRFKERWQMQTEQDAKNATVYSGPDLTLSLQQNGTNNIKFFETQCGQWKPYSGTLPTNYASTEDTVGVAFTKDNDRIFAYNNGNCYLYDIARETIGTASSTSGLTCPAYNASPQTRVAMSENGRLVITKSASPFVGIWQQNNIYFTEFNSASPAVLFSTNPPTMPTSIAISRNARYLALTGAAYTYVYVRTAPRTYTRVADPGFTVPAAAISFSDDESMMAMAVNSSSNVQFYSINKTTNVFTLESTLTVATFNTTILNFSPDGNYLVLAGGGPVAGATHNSAINIYKIEGTTATLMSPGGTYTYTGTFTDARFSADSSFLILPFSGSGDTKRGTIFRRTAINVFTEVGTLNAMLNASEEPLYIRFKR